MWKKSVFLALIVAVAGYYYNSVKTAEQELSPIIEISTGKLQGVIGYSRSGREVHEYYKIPFARPPLADLRFESPQPAEKWEGILKADKMGAKCMQVDIITQQRYGEEDCLYLNVYVPKVDENKKKPLPVMVFIHGGIFMYGGTDIFGPKYFVDEDVILVTIAYRLASFGFLNTGGDGVVRGNMGLKDQVLALKWIQKNIYQFGGNKNQVLIFGESAGASSVHLHQMSKMSLGLFHKAISQSGTAISPFVLSRHPAEQAKRLGSQMNCPTEDSKQLVACLKKVDAIDIIEGAHRETSDLLHESIGVFSPTIETIEDSDAFLTEDPMEILRQGKLVNKVPWITGVNQEEGLILSAAITTNETILQALDQNWNDVAPKFFFYERNDTFSKKVRKHYFLGKSKKIGTPQNLHKFTSMLSDRSFFWPVSESALLQSKMSPVYLYYYSHISDFSLAHFITLFRGRFHYIVEILVDLLMASINKNILGRRHHYYGCCHADEQWIQFNTPICAEVLPENREQYKISKDFVKLWADFAKDKKDLNFRGVKWTPINPNKTPFRYLMIDMSYGMVDEPFATRIAFWKNNYVV